MNLFIFAMEIEKESEEYYRKLFNICPNESLKKILALLANEEVKHYNIIQKMKEDKLVQIEDTNILKDAKNVFSAMSKDSNFDFQSDFSDLLEEAKVLEKKSKEYYFKKAEESDNKDHKILFLKLVDEEEMHYFLLDNIIEFLSRPKSWVENAEFYHLDEY